MKKTLLATILIALSLPVTAQYKIIFDNLNIKLPEPATKSAISFDGMDDYVDISNTGSVSQPVTFEAYFDFSKLDKEIIISAEDNGTIAFQMGYNVRSTNAVSAGIYNGSWTVIDSGITPDTDKFYHLAFVWDGSTMKLYLDGQNVGEKSISSIHPTPEVYLGLSDFADGGIYFEGSLIEARRWSTARTQTEIQNNMDKELTGNETGLAAYYKLDSGSGTTAVDSAGNNDGTINGATWVEK